MTQIVLHPREVAQWGPYGGQRVTLPPPWLWWETRVYDYATPGRQLEIRCDPVPPEDIENYFLTFGEDRDRVVLRDPPSVFLIHIAETSEQLDGSIHRVVLTRSTLTARVVWWARPGPHWQPLPYVRTCRPGFYQHDTETRGLRTRDRDPHDQDWCDAFSEVMPELAWPQHPMLVGGVPVGPPPPGRGDRAIQRLMDEANLSVDCSSWFGDIQFPREQVLRGPTGAAIQAAVEDSYRQIVGSGGVRELGRSPNVLPESELIDEIDRLVNEQVKPGPLDDYHADRYPKCTHCYHDWHGILCEKCDCLGELEDPA